MLKKIKYAFWKSTKVFGFEILPNDIRNSIQSYLKFLFKKSSINLVIDIGANKGQYSSMITNIGYSNDIVLIEPLDKEWMYLKNLVKTKKNWILYDKVGIGSKIENLKINYTSNSVSSSFLMPKNNMINYEVIDKQNVHIITLEYLLAELNINNKNIFLKIDAQGFEYEIIKGARNILDKILYVQLELSIVTLYENEHDYKYITNYMNDLGFKEIFIFPGILNDNSEVIQLEIIYKNINFEK